MTIFDTLKLEHERFRSMYEKLLSEKKRGKLFEDFNRYLDIHMEGEEQILYPRAKEIGLTEIVLAAIEEHHVAKLILHELEGMSGTEETWLPKLQVLIENIERHLQEEEKKLFPSASMRLDLQTQDDMNHLYWDFKATADVHRLCTSHTLLNHS